MKMISRFIRPNRIQKIFNREKDPAFRLFAFVVACFLFIDGLEAQTNNVEEIAPGIYLWPGVQEAFSAHNRGHIANIGFIVGSERVAVIDTGSTYKEGLALRKMITEITDLPIAYVILTHMHPDHALGAAAFIQDEPVYIGHEQLNEALARRRSTYLNRMKQLLGNMAEGTEMVFLSQAVGVGQILKLNLGGRTLHLRAYQTAHTNNDLSVYDDATGSLWFSDLLFVEHVPVVDGSLLGWLKVIDELSSQTCISISLHPKVVATKAGESKERSTTLEKGRGGECSEVKRIVPGHGPVVTQWRKALTDQHRYLDHIANGIRNVIKKGGTITQAVESVGWEERDHWLLFEDYHGRNVTAAFAELEWE